MSIARQGLAIVIFLLVIELFYVATILAALQDARTKLANEWHLVEVVSQSTRIGNLMQRLGTALAQDAMHQKLRQMLGKHEDAKSLRIQINKEFKVLKELAGDDSETLAIIRSQQTVLRDVTQLYRADKAFYKNAKQDRIYSQTLLVMDDISADYRRFLERFKAVNQDAPRETSESITSVKRIIYCGLILNLVAGLTLALFFVRRVTARISQLCDSIAKFQRHKALPPESSHRDEIGQLDRMFRGMVESLTLARAREEALIEGAYDVICTIDSSGLFTAVNSACTRQWGFSKSELVGQHYSSIISPSQLPEVNHQLSKSRRMSAFVSFDTIVVKRDGEMSDTSFSCFWSADDDTNFCFVHDLGEINKMKHLLQAGEEQIRELLNSVPIAVMVVDENGKVRFANKKMESLTLCSRDELANRAIGDLIEPGFLSVEDVLSSDRLSSTAPADCLLKCSDGRKIRTNINVEPLVLGPASSEQRPVEKVVFLEDVEERVRLDNLKREFIALLREKLRRPLVAMRDLINSASATDEAELNPAAQKERVRISRILTSTDRLLKLIDELLNIELLEPGKLVGELRPSEVSAILAEAVEALEDYANKQGINVKLSVAEGLILADAGRLVQVAINLISNAIKFSPGGSEVLVSVVESGESFEFSVTDSGRGVPLVDQEAIFKPYVQSSSSDAKKGTGLGLPICKAIVESHHGRIGVTSGPEGGSRFWFLIPKSGEW